MLEQNYFEHRLGDIYQYSHIPYKCGEGRTSDGIEYCWELCVDVSGNIIFVLSSEKSIQSISNISEIERFSGVSDDGVWKITCTNIHILKAKSDVLETEDNVLEALVLFCLPSSIDLTHISQPANNPTLARAYFSNFNFCPIDLERGFTLNINDKRLCFQLLENSKQLIELIDIERIPNAIFSHVSIPINQDDNIQDIEAEVRSISWFLSFLNLNLNFTPIIEYFSDNEIIRYFIENTVKNSFSRSYIVDNYRIDEGIPNAFNECYGNYKTLNEEIDINILFGFLAEIKHQKYIDIKLAVMIIAYEYFLTKYLIYREILRSDQITNSIQSKLGSINSCLRFIPSEMLDDVLRGSVRNPLFHQGEIPLMELSSKIDIFKRYYDLLIKIVLRVLAYTGKYMSVESHTPIDL